MTKSKLVLATLILVLLQVPLESAIYYVAPTGGSDSNSGTDYSAPLASFSAAVSKLGAGDTLILKNGTYVDKPLTISKRHGTSISPITIKAERDYHVTLQGAGATIGAKYKALVYLYMSSWIVVEGIRAVDSEATCFWLDGSDDCIIRRCVARRPDNYGRNDGNNHCFWIDSSHSYYENSSELAERNLIEDCMAFEFHRHGMTSYTRTRDNVFRRCYVNAFGYQSDSSYRPPGNFSNEGFSSYGGTGTIFENCVADGVQGAAFNNHGLNSLGGQRCRWYGVVARNAVSGLFMNSRTPKDSGWLTNNLVLNSAFIANTNMSGVEYVHGSDNTLSNCALVGNQSAGLICYPMHEYWDAATFEYQDPAMKSRDMDLRVYNTVISSNSRHGYYVNWDNYGRTPTTFYEGTYTLTLDGCMYWNNALGNFKVPDPRYVVNDLGAVSVNPNYEASRYGDGAYLMPPPGHPGKGATILNRYVNGNLTDEPLWPWPTEDQVMEEIGVSVSWAANGGIWKTLDGVYEKLSNVPNEPKVQNTTFLSSLDAADALLLERETLLPDPYMSIQGPSSQKQLAAQVPSPVFLMSSHPERGQAHFHPAVPAAGNYTIWCQVMTTDSESDSFYISINNEGERIFETKVWAPVWRWTRLATYDPSRLEDVRDTQYLRAGVNEISFRGRDANTMLARLLITNDLNFVPAEVEASRVAVQIRQTNYGRILKWTSVPGVVYRVFFSTDFRDSPWTVVSGAVEASGPESEWLAPASHSSAGFYWVHAEM